MPVYLGDWVRCEKVELYWADYCDADAARVRRDFMIAAQGSHPLLGPLIAATGTQAISIEDTRNQSVRAHAREDPHGVDCFFRCLSHVFTASAPGAAYLGMDAALPVDH